MAFEQVDKTLVTHDLVQDLKWDSELDRYALKPEERTAIETGDFHKLYEMGLHPYLGGQLARLIYGNAAGPDATRAVNRLIASLTGEERPDDRTTT